MSLYPVAARIQARNNIKRLENFAARLEGIAKGYISADPAFLAGVAALTDCSELEAQHAALLALKDAVEQDHRTRLIAAAPDCLHAYAEVITPHEPPAAHHIFLADKLMSVEHEKGKRLLISMPPGHAKDLCVETPVMMGDGSWKRLGDIVPGDHVISHLGRPAYVSAVHDQGEREVLKITTTTGRSVFAHPEHVFLTPGGWKEARDLEVGEKLTLLREYEIPPGDCTVDEWAFLGYIMARAIVTGRVYSRLTFMTSTFRCDDALIRADITDIARRLGIRATLRRETIYDTEAALLTFNQPARDLLKAWGLMRVKKTEVRVPERIFTGSEAAIGAFLGAILSCDATFVPDTNKQTGAPRKINLVMRGNRGLALDLQRLFQRLGIKTTFVASHLSNYNYRPETFFKLEITDPKAMDLIGRRIRFVSKHARLWALGTPPDYEHPLYLGDAITEIRPAKPRQTRCLTVDEDHSFVADGLVVHNSTYSSRYFPSWYLGRGEYRKYLQAGHTQDFSEREFGKKTRDIIDSDAFRSVFPGVFLRHDSKAAGKWILANGNEYTVKGVGQGISGVRSTCNGVDDPYPTYESAQSELTRRKTWDWFANDFMTRLLPGGGAMIVATRWHVDDLCGRIEEKLKEGDPNFGEWEIINLPALCLDPDSDQMSRILNAPLWPEYYDFETLQRQKALMSSAQWACLYDGQPIPADGQVIKRDWLVHSSFYPTVHVSRSKFNLDNTDRDPAVSGEARDPRDSEQGPIFFTRTVVSVDSAETEDKRSDFSAITVWRETPNKYHYLVDAFRDRMEFTKLIAAVEDMAQRWDADFILMEKKGAGNQYIQARGDKGLAPCPVIGVDPTRKGDKTFRMDGVSPIFQQKRVIFPERAPWLADLERELLQFPGAKHDDYADTISQYLSWVRATTHFKRGARKMGGLPRSRG